MMRNNAPHSSLKAVILGEQRRHKMEKPKWIPQSSVPTVDCSIILFLSMVKPESFRKNLRSSSLDFHQCWKSKSIKCLFSICLNIFRGQKGCFFGKSFLFQSSSVGNHFGPIQFRKNKKCYINYF